MGLGEFPRKLKFETVHEWSHHRGGWPFCVKALANGLHNDGGVLCLTNGIYYKMIRNRHSPYQEPWVAFLHSSPGQKLAEFMRTNPDWIESLKSCVGLFVLSDHLKTFVEPLVPVPVSRVPYPAERTGVVFEWDRFMANDRKRLLHVGHWQRDFQAFLGLPQDGYVKTLIACLNWPEQVPGDVEVVPMLSPEAYDEWLSMNVVFLRLFESSANTTVVECIVRGTPLVINRLPALEEYLGKDYCLFYENIAEAAKIVGDHDRLRAGYLYLRDLDKGPFRVENFVRAVAESNVYRSLPVFGKTKLFL